MDFTPSSPCPEDDTRTNGFSDLGSSLPSRLVAGLEGHFLFALSVLGHFDLSLKEKSYVRTIQCYILIIRKFEYVVFPHWIEKIKRT